MHFIALKSVPLSLVNPFVAQCHFAQVKIPLCKLYPLRQAHPSAPLQQTV